jgi:hypothetical protein
MRSNNNAFNRRAILPPDFGSRGSSVRTRPPRSKFNHFRFRPRNPLHQFSSNVGTSHRAVPTFSDPAQGQQALVRFPSGESP